MKTKTLGVATLLAAATLSVGISMNVLSANAETTNDNGATIYTSAEKDYWMITDGSGDYTVSLDNAASRFPSYKGVETVITPAENVHDIGITLKGMVNPMANMIIAHDNQEHGVADANAIVYTFTSLSDPDRQISIIATHRGNRSWYTFAFTDELELKDSYTYIEGTAQKTIGYRDLSSYDTLGYCAWGAGEYNWGAIYEGLLLCKLDSNGNVYYNDSTVIGCMKDESFLAASKANLAGTKYEERYTSEWITETLTQLSKGARMELKWYDVQTDKVDFHIRGISGSWIGDNGGKGLEANLGVKHSTIIYKKTNTLYVGETYKLSDLLYGGGYSFRNAENEGAKLSISGWYANSVNKTAGNNADSTWYNGLTQMNKTITMSEAGTYSMTMRGGMLGYWHSTDFTTDFTFDVVEKTKVIYSCNGTSSDSIPVERWTDITVAAAPNESQIPNGYEFIGWKLDETMYTAGSTYTVDGSGEDVSFTAVLKDIEKPVITVGDYTDTYYDGDELTLLSATVTDNSGESLDAIVTVSKNGENVDVQENKVTLSAGTYTIVYTATDSSGNKETIEKTISVQEKVGVVYTLGGNEVHSDSHRPGTITLWTLPTEQIPVGYVFTGWSVGSSAVTGETYTLGTESVTFAAQLQAIEYKATLVYLDKTKDNEIVTFTIENRTEKLAEIKNKLPEANNGYGNSWKDLPNELPLENVTYEEVEGAITYKITFVGVEGVDPIEFTVETKDTITLPAVPAKEGYAAAWDKTLGDITLANITITAQYTAIEYQATLTYLDTTKGSEIVTFTIENRTEKLAEIKSKLPEANNGYTNAWKDLSEVLPLENVTYVETQTAITYKLTFVGVDGIAPIEFTVETKDTITLPVLAEREGYTAAWDKTLGDVTLENITFTATYTAIEYTATVIVNGQETTVTYTIENRDTKLELISAMKPVADNEYYSYVWETELPETLPLENGKTYKVVKNYLGASDSSSGSDSSDVIDSSAEDSESSSSENALTSILGSCTGSIDGGCMAMVSVALCGAAILLSRKKERNENE